MIKNRMGILVPNTPVMRDLVPKMPNETPIGVELKADLLATENNVAIATEYGQPIRINNLKNN